MTTRCIVISHYYIIDDVRYKFLVDLTQPPNEKPTDARADGLKIILDQNLAAVPFARAAVV